MEWQWKGIWFKLYRKKDIKFSLKILSLILYTAYVYTLKHAWITISMWMYFTWHGYFTFKIQLALKDYPTYITTSIKQVHTKGLLIRILKIWLNIMIRVGIVLELLGEYAEAFTIMMTTEDLSPAASRRVHFYGRIIRRILRFTSPAASTDQDSVSYPVYINF